MCNAVNLISYQYNNCEITDVCQYKKCSKENSICGRPQCINVRSSLDFPARSIVISHICRRKISDAGHRLSFVLESLGDTQMGVINDGTSGSLNRTCVNSSVLKFHCLPDK